MRTLGYTFFGDSIYHLSFTFPHAADALTLDFASDLFEGKGPGTRAGAWITSRSGSPTSRRLDAPPAIVVCGYCHDLVKQGRIDTS